MNKISKDPSLIESDKSAFDLEIQQVLHKKLATRKLLADKFSLIKLNYMMCVLRYFYEDSATMSDPEAFKDKVRRIEKKTKTMLHR